VAGDHWDNLKVQAGFRQSNFTGLLANLGGNMPQIVSVPPAEGPDKIAGWRYGFEFMQQIQKISERTCGERISLEAVDAVIGALLTQKIGDLRCVGCGSILPS